MGNSLLDVCVFGRIAGGSAASYIKEKFKDGKLTLDHVRRYHKELKEAGIVTDRLLPCCFLITLIPRSGSASSRPTTSVPSANLY
jgi:hypothetical protein